MRNRITAAFAAALITIAVVAGVIAQTDTTEQIEPTEREIIMAVMGGRVRSAPNIQGDILKESALGTRFIAVSEKGGWDEVRLGAGSEDGSAAVTGWIAKSITEPYDRVRPGVQFQKFARKYLSQKEINFRTANQLFEVLPSAADDAKSFEVGGDLRLKSLIALSLALKAIPFGKAEASPYKEFLAKYSNDVVYSEPAGQWYVRSDRYWELHQRYKKYKVGEEIAWKAAGNPIPGECEGYINCYLYLLRATEGEYLNFYPNGKYSKQSLGNINSMLQPIVADSREKRVYYTTSDISDRAEFNRMLAELRKIVSRTPFVEKQSILRQIDQIAEGYR